MHICDLPAVPQLYRCIEQVSNIEGTAPDLWHSPVDVQQGIYRLHAGAHGVFRSEDGISGGLGELADKGKIDGPFGHYSRPVSRRPGHEKGGDIGHHAGDGVGAVLGQILDLLLRYAQVVEPLHADLFTGAVPHSCRVYR